MGRVLEGRLENMVFLGAYFQRRFYGGNKCDALFTAPGTTQLQTYCFGGLGGFPSFLLRNEDLLILLAPLDQPLARLPQSLALCENGSMRKKIK